MAYVRRTDVERLSPDTVLFLGRLAGLELPPEDLDELAESLSSQLASIHTLARLELAGVNPAVEFDPRWPEENADDLAK